MSGGKHPDASAMFGHEMMPDGRDQAGPGELPSTTLLRLIGDKWTTVVLYCLSRAEVRRFNELQRWIPLISKKMLVKVLRQLESDGLVERTVYPEVPPRTDYRLTEDGHRLREPIAAMCQWGQDNRAFLSGVLTRRAK